MIKPTPVTLLGKGPNAGMRIASEDRHTFVMSRMRPLSTKDWFDAGVESPQMETCDREAYGIYSLAFRNGYGIYDHSVEYFGVSRDRYPTQMFDDPLRQALNDSLDLLSQYRKFIQSNYALHEEYEAWCKSKKLEP